MRYLILCATLTTVCAAQSFTAASAQTVSLPAADVVAMRQSSMDQQQGMLAAMKAAVDAKTDVKGFTDGAKGLVAAAKTIPAHFPAGTDKVEGTKAKPAIWSDPADFAKDARSMADASSKLVALAEANDKTGFAAQFAEVGKTCGACHRAYKER